MKIQIGNIHMMKVKKILNQVKTTIKSWWLKFDNFLEIVNEGLTESRNRGYGPKS